MREIKFRAWDKDYGMKYFDSFESMSSEGNPYGYLLFGAASRSESDSWNEKPWTNSFFGELMQYIGLEDKNGKEIYEGDIVKSSINEISEIWGIEVDNLSKPLHSPKHGMPFDNKWIDHEVLGNIYENPELLKAPQKGDDEK